METWLLITIIVVTVVVIGVVVMMMMGGDEEAAAAEMHKTIDLNDPKVLGAVQEDGVQLTVGATEYLQVADAGKKGFSWIINEECNDIVDVEILEGPPMKEEAAAAEEEKPAEKEEAADEKKEEKRLRDGHEEKGEEKAAPAEEKGEETQVYMSATGTNAGSCNFTMVYAESWDFAKDSDENATSISFNITVANATEAAGNSTAEEK